MNPKQIVADSYNRISERYTEWAAITRQEERARYTAVLLEKLPAGAQVLELGCGAGIPTTQELAQRFIVTGVDISSEQIKRARQNVPNATFICADMCQVDLAPASFDAVAAFYSIFHVPRDEHGALFQKVEGWLRPGGLLVVTMGLGSVEGDLVEDWLGFGAPMYWSNYESGTNCVLVEQAGFDVLRAKKETAEEDGVPITFLWIVAQKQAPAHDATVQAK